MTPFDQLAPRWMAALQKDLALTAEQAAGLLGNLGFESNGFQNLQEIHPVAGRGGLGVAQWTGPRRRAFERWCATAGLATTSDEGNYGFLLVELMGAYKSTVAALRRMQTLETAVFSVGQTYERPGGTTPTHLPGYADRLAWARRALAGAIAKGVMPHDDSGSANRTLGQLEPPTPPHKSAPPVTGAADGEDEAEALNRAELDRLGGNNG